METSTPQKTPSEEDREKKDEEEETMETGETKTEPVSQEAKVHFLRYPCIL